MYIEGKDRIRINGWLRMCDLDCGEVFVFEDDNGEIFIKDENGNGINLETGTVLDYNDYDYCDKVVRRIKCKLVIED